MSIGASGGASRNNDWGGDGANGIYGSGGSGAGCGWYSVNGTIDTYYAHKLGGDGGDGYIYIQYTF
jgi:hypothetical protein